MAYEPLQSLLAVDSFTALVITNRYSFLFTGYPAFLNMRNSSFTIHEIAIRLEVLRRTFQTS